MSDTKQKPDLKDLTEPGGAAPGAGYEAWKTDKVKKAKAEARKNPDKLISHDEARKRLGLEY